MIDIFIPSYHRPDNIKTAKYLVGLGYDPKRIHVVIDDEADDLFEYEHHTKKMGVHLHVFSIAEARSRYDYVHRKPLSRRSVGQARNMFYDIAKGLGIVFYIVIDDDTRHYELQPFGVYKRSATFEEITDTFVGIREMMERRRIGMFGISQTGDMFERFTTRVWRKKVMNTTFIDTRFIYRGEKGGQDEDTVQFVSAMNEGYFTGSLASGLILSQMPSAKQKGGLTELYQEAKLLNKATVVTIMYPSCSRAERQERNGGRLHHRINYRYLMPCLIKGKRDNIAWDTYPEDVPFTNEPRRKNTDETT